MLECRRNRLRRYDARLDSAAAHFLPTCRRNRFRARLAARVCTRESGAAYPIPYRRDHWDIDKHRARLARARLLELEFCFLLHRVPN